MGFLYYCISLTEIIGLLKNIHGWVKRDSSNVISVKQTIEIQKPIPLSLLAIPALSGCDSIPALYGILKANAVGAVISVSLSIFENSNPQKMNI